MQTRELNTIQDIFSEIKQIVKENKWIIQEKISSNPKITKEQWIFEKLMNELEHCLLMVTFTPSNPMRIFKTDVNIQWELERYKNKVKLSIEEAQKDLLELLKQHKNVASYTIVIPSSGFAAVATVERNCGELNTSEFLIKYNHNALILPWHFKILLKEISSQNITLKPIQIEETSATRNAPKSNKKKNEEQELYRLPNFSKK